MKAIISFAFWACLPTAAAGSRAYTEVQPSNYTTVILPEDPGAECLRVPRKCCWRDKKTRLPGGGGLGTTTES